MYCNYLIDKNIKFNCYIWIKSIFYKELLKMQLINFIFIFRVLLTGKYF